MTSADGHHGVFCDLHTRDRDHGAAGPAATATVTCTSHSSLPQHVLAASPATGAVLSLFESIITTYPPVLESLLSQLPTRAILDLYHTSSHLRRFLQRYPLAWKTLSFRLPQPAVTAPSPGNETPDGGARTSKYASDALLKEVVCPYGTRLKSLDLCNTAVSGTALVVSVLAPRTATLEHLSVRGCKNVSLKYHIVPFLEPYTLKNSPWVPKDLALRSLYTYRCRHHRRRPYLPASLARRDSDSDPTHQLIEICHELNIWTDTAWCPTPGGRCYRRKDYHSGRAGPQSLEVWVPFDRLWRSGNRIGPTDNNTNLGGSDGRLWEIAETGYEGEPLGPENAESKGEGKHVPTHLRKSHTTFIEGFKCAQCNDTILERCESCCVRMHCMGCRKTLCASCAFNRPIPRKRAKTRHFQNLAFGPNSTLGSTLSQASGSSVSLASQTQIPKPRPANRFWWAPGAVRSPNLMNESAHGDDSSDSEDGGNFNNGIPAPPNMREPPKLNMHWCCLEPIFSGGGGIAVVGTGLGGRGADNIRAVPLPRTKRFEDPDFSNQLRPVDYVRELKHNGLVEYVLGEDLDILSYLKQDSLDLQAQTCPRGLCQDCYRSFRWKVSCRCCKAPLCKEHDFRALKFRKCGYRDMQTEREYVRTHNEPPRLAIPDFNPNKSKGKEPTLPLNANPAQESAAAFDGGVEHSQPVPLSQSQILLPPSAPSAVDMSASTSLTSHTSSADHFSNSGSLPFVPVSSNRPRSFSASGVRSRNSASWPNSPRAVNPISNTLPLPCNPRHPVQWEGCGAYFCQYPRPVGDNRNTCPAVIRQCAECEVLVCDACSSANPMCPCTYCTMNYHCPHCARKKEVIARCQLEAETKLREDAEKRAKEKMEKEKEERGQADELAGAVFEFWSFLTNEVMDEIAQTIADGEAALEDDDEVVQGVAELPAPSPADSITVTTSFGVTQEPSNFTTVHAAGATPPAASAENEPEIHLQGPESASQQDSTAVVPLSTPLSPASLSLAATPSVDIEVAQEDSDIMDEEEDDADFEVDDIDTESALLDEFIDDGAMTPSSSTDT
ncbi:hypothetical protein BCR34DRAFT_491863 [Clohesyomyces aquaticus]|uniref:Uncharacterized protein n=1 Tax=Clohesyomyces aquaticus TaxID=1231657 RepID=A0A1Y1Z2I1_9PLEO|nr:hypothetical protein BCR34DRAFT_491863 [Clohesyomyces aquaticus]